MTSLAELIQTEPTTKIRPDRTVNQRWLIGAGTDHYGQPCQNHLVLSTYHVASRRAYISSLNVEQHRDGTMSCLPFDAQRIHSEPCGRYSAKTLAQAAQHALDAARLLEDDAITVKTA